MKDVYAENLRDLVGKAITDFFMAKEVSVRTTKRGKDYVSMLLGDKTGEFYANAWDMSETDAKVGDVVKVKARVAEWDGKPQLSIEMIRVAKDGEYDLNDFIKALPQDKIKGMLAALSVAVDSLEQPYRSAIHWILDPNIHKFANAQAATKVHHAYVGGLLEHVMSLIDCARYVSSAYGLDQDLMVSACIVHDVGKIHELQEGAFTKKGSLLGHISIGLMMLHDAFTTSSLCPSMDKSVKEEAYDKLAHIVLSHHGLKEWGSPVLPATKEAMAFHLIDMLDARMKIMDEAVEEGVDEEGFTQKVFTLGIRVYSDKK